MKTPLRDVTASSENRQLCKRVRDLEAKTGTDLCTEESNVVPSNSIQQSLQKHYSSWTNGAQVPLSAEIDVLKDQQLGRCPGLAHHWFTMKLPANWYPTDMGTSEDGYITVRKCYGSKGTYYLDCE
eukprot:473845-Rhodomonas_salina.1